MSKFLTLAAASILITISLYVVYTTYIAPSPQDSTIIDQKLLETAFVVTLTTDGYEPAEFSIPAGTVVTFRSTTGKPHWPASNLHPTHEIYAAFDPLKPIDPDKEWSFVFEYPGTWNFHDHLRAYYTGTLHVTAEKQ